MSLAELATITQYDLKLKVIVLNDSRYGMIWHFQREQFHGRHVSVDLTNVDFAEIARGFGMKAIRVENPNDLKKAYQEILTTNEAGLLDIVVNSEVPYLF
jgi:acetolactate synthase-1/2/3 large subunit